ncbi:uncharacterized protein LOC141972890 isoform X2 [Athene noctua]|uniref:uncharacterized protein LOC141972890 isoform X2 n=1 Tax=Athene noctua TaxID=126797 RepID=UPI003EB7F65C
MRELPKPNSDQESQTIKKAGHRRQHLGEGATGLMDRELLDLPLGAKIPVLPGSRPVFSRAKLGEKLQLPSGHFDLGDPYCRLLRREYNSLHDPYLKAYHNRRRNFRRLREAGLVTSDGQVGLDAVGLIKTIVSKRASPSSEGVCAGAQLPTRQVRAVAGSVAGLTGPGSNPPLVSSQVTCTLKEFNDYRQYLLTLRVQAENVARQEEVGRAECSRPAASGTVLRAGAVLAVSRGGGQCRRGEGWAGGPGLVTGKRPPSSELSWHRALGRAWAGQEGHVQARGVLREEALVFLPHHTAEAGRWPGPVRSLRTGGRETLSRQQRATTWCHLSGEASAAPGQI